MKSHAANIQKSARLKRLLSALQADRLRSTAELQAETGSMAIHSDAHELRCNGIPVSNAVYMGKENGHKKYGYKLETANA